MSTKTKLKLARKLALAEHSQTWMVAWTFPGPNALASHCTFSISSSLSLSSAPRAFACTLMQGALRVEYHTGPHSLRTDSFFFGNCLSAMHIHSMAPACKSMRACIIYMYRCLSQKCTWHVLLRFASLWYNSLARILQRVRCSRACKNRAGQGTRRPHVRLQCC